MEQKARGGKREGAGRKPTGRSRKVYSLTDEEDIQVKSIINDREYPRMLGKKILDEVLNLEELLNKKLKESSKYFKKTQVRYNFELTQDGLIRDNFAVKVFYRKEDNKQERLLFKFSSSQVVFIDDIIEAIAKTIEVPSDFESIINNVRGAACLELAREKI